MTKVAQVPVSTRSWHVVLAPLVDTDFSLSARIAAALMGGFYTTPQDFLNQDESPRGIMYTKRVFTWLYQPLSRSSCSYSRHF